MDDHPDIRVFCFRETKNRPIFLLFYYLPRGSKEKFFAFFGGLRKGVPVATISFGTHTSLENVAQTLNKKMVQKSKYQKCNEFHQSKCILLGNVCNEFSIF